jgi:N-acetylmuramoyl-L-alanine amidase
MSQPNLFISVSTIVSSIATAFLIAGVPAPTAAIAQTAGTPISVPAPTATAAFAQQDIDATEVVAVASPYGEGEHQLLVLQQMTDEKPCWSVTGTDVKTIDPLLLSFDFTGICGRATDSNGYSIRMAGQDIGWRYSLQVSKRNGEMWLIGKPTGAKKTPELKIARIKGTPEGFGQFEMASGWRITKRTFNGEALGHFYFTHEQTLAALTQKTVSLK